MSIEVTRAVADGEDYLIPDPTKTGWMSINPGTHAELTSAANLARSKRWVPIVKMIKKWNEHQGRPVEPSFLLEVMALELVTAPWIGPYPRELKMLFASAVDRITEVWPDPAGLGSPVSDTLALNQQLLAQARIALADAEKLTSEPIRRQGWPDDCGARDLAAALPPAFRQVMRTSM